MVASEDNRLTSAEAQLKARECREMASRTMRPAHRIMLEHIADTWNRVAFDEDLARPNLNS
jgi:hypothetical protein